MTASALPRSGVHAIAAASFREEELLRAEVHVRSALLHVENALVGYDVRDLLAPLRDVLRVLDDVREALRGAR